MLRKGTKSLPLVPFGKGAAGALAVSGGEWVKLEFFRRDVAVSVLGRKYRPPEKVKAEGDCGLVFSRESMQSLLWIVNNTDVVWRSLITLTYPDSWPWDLDVIKEHLRMFLQTLGRVWKGMLYLWVMEFQDRGAPHFHMITSIPIKGTLWNPNGPDGKPDPECWSSREQHEWVSTTWQTKIKQFGTLAGLEAGCRWEKLKSSRGGAAYMATYLGKCEQKKLPDGFVNPGAWWRCPHKVGRIEPTHSVVVPASEYFRHAEGVLCNKDGYLYGTIHNGRERCKHWLTVGDGDADASSGGWNENTAAAARAYRRENKLRVVTSLP